MASSPSEDGQSLIWVLSLPWQCFYQYKGTRGWDGPETRNIFSSKVFMSQRCFPLKKPWLPYHQPQGIQKLLCFTHEFFVRELRMTLGRRASIRALLNSMAPNTLVSAHRPTHSPSRMRTDDQRWPVTISPHTYRTVYISSTVQALVASWDIS